MSINQLGSTQNFLLRTFKDNRVTKNRDKGKKINIYISSNKIYIYI